MNDGVKIVSLTEQISLIAKETVEDFIIETIEPYCSEVAEIKISKEELKKVILKNYGMPKPKWIPVSKRLPESLMVKTLVSCEDNNGLPISPMVALYDGYNKTWICAYKVIAWMPLPEPYKTESEGKE